MDGRQTEEKVFFVVYALLCDDCNETGTRGTYSYSAMNESVFATQQPSTVRRLSILTTVMAQTEEII